MKEPLGEGLLRSSADDLTLPRDLASEPKLRRSRRTRRQPLVPQARNDTAPLSYAQERLWFLDQLGLVGSAYNASMRLSMAGTLNVVALERSLAEIVRRHESLRTRFNSIQGTPVQVVDPVEIFVLSIRDLSELEETERASQANYIGAQEAQHRFDLAKGPPLRVLLLKISNQEHVLLITMHHIVTDGWSWEVLHQELSTLYTAYSQGRDSPLVELSVQYADYAIWQRQWFRDDLVERQLRYWRKQLDGASFELRLPTDYPRPSIGSYRGKKVKFDLTAALSAGVKELARQEKATLFMVCLAAYQVLLSRWTGQQDILVGSPIAGRSNQEVEGLIGFFVNTLVLRADMSEMLTFRQLLARVKDSALEAYAHADLPFDVLVKELSPDRNLAKQPLFQASMVLLNEQGPRYDLPGLTCVWEETESATTHFDLTLFLCEHSDRVSGAFDYATDLFDQDTIERMSTHFLTLLGGIVENPDCPVQRLPMLSEQERHLLLVEWNRTAMDYHHGSHVHELFSEQAARTPDAKALIQESVQVTYCELERKSNQLARHLRHLGVGADVIVGICLERTPDLVVGLLGILKAGGAYLPLDPAYPKERLSFMFRDSRSTLLLTKSTLIDKVPCNRDRVVQLDNDWQSIDSWSAESLDHRVRSENLAYVIYTSGSTGVPKGVLVEHGGFLNYVKWALHTYVPESGDAIPVSSSVAFDATATSLYCALLSGRSAVLLTDGNELQDLEQLLLQPIRWSLIKVSPAHLQALGPRLQMMKANRTVAAIVVGGEMLPPTTVELWRSIWPDVRIFNQYGPTETVVACTAHEIPHDWVATDPVPIGRPVWNTHLYVLDSLMQPVPIGVVGELYIGGVQVSRGYLDRPDLTKERFVDNPFDTSSGRLYRTGDSVRYLANGSLEFVGRIDSQIKVRGYRIELGEIESQLRRCVQVREAVVVAREDIPGEKRLVAYLTLHDSQPTSGEVLRSLLRERLPEYMVPAAYVILDALPLTSNGKVDRRALPIPGVDAYSTVRYEAPMEGTEVVLEGVWRELLQIERIGRNDNFFELGGHSLHGIRLISRVAEALQVRLLAVAVFQHPTIRQMAAVVESLRALDEGPLSGSTLDLEQGTL